MKHALYLASARAGKLAALLLAFMVSCQAPVSPELIARLERVEKVSGDTAATTATIPGLGAVSGISGAVSVITAALIAALPKKKNGGPTG